MFNRFMALTRQLFPRGRVFNIPFGSRMERMLRGLSRAETDAWADAVSVLDSALPDNDNFTAQDATDWEQRLGLIAITDLSLTARKARIIRKMNHPGTIPARQNYRYMEAQLQAAGFDVYVFENKFDDGGGGFETRSPGEVSGSAGTYVGHGSFNHGGTNHGNFYGQKVAINLDEQKDVTFNAGSRLRRTFFVGGTPVGQFADVPLARRQEFRELIFKIKPVQTVAWLFINYTE